MTSTLERPRSLEDILKPVAKYDVDKEDFTGWDKGVFLNELRRQRIALSTDENGDINGNLVATKTFAEASAAEFHAKGLELITPTIRTLEAKQQIYQWSPKAGEANYDGYPPHLYVAPPTSPEAAAEQQKEAAGIFDANESAFVKSVSSAFSFIIPNTVTSHGTPYAGPTIADCEKWNNDNKSPNTDIMHGANIGNLDDWYSDARFAQQHLSGVNPCTIETAPSDKVKAYVDEADKQGLGGMKKVLSEGKDLFIQDYSYFREATGVSNDEDFVNIVPNAIDPSQVTAITQRYACASVVLFQLHPDGRLHLLVITLDYKGSLDKSITIFNRRLTPDDKGDIDEKEDWPWRYAKTCAQTADWARHEIAVHLVDTHLIEEAIIVATNRTIPEKHLLYEILSPQWFRTLPLNAMARTLLVPAVIARLSGLGPTINPATSRAVKLVRWSFDNFNFQDKYVPNDLKKRGFDLKPENKEKYRNYPYATDINYLWYVIRAFVESVLKTKYTSDKAVQDDEAISNWYKEIQGNGEIPTFPTITTLDQLIDAVTMCIHIASTQHTAVNYLQDYYYSFVPSKPPALCTPLPKDLESLKTYTEKELTAALPIGIDGPKWKDWLLAAQLPELLSYQVEQNYNLVSYATSLFRVNKNRTDTENEKYKSEAIRDAAKLFYSRLMEAKIEVKWNSDKQTEGTVPYKVLEPELTAVLILI